MEGNSKIIIIIIIIIIITSTFCGKFNRPVFFGLYQRRYKVIQGQRL